MRFERKTIWQYILSGLLLCLLTASGAFAQVSGTVYQDLNANGAQGTATPNLETGYGGITVKAFNAAGTMVASTTTAANGTYTLTGVTGPVRVEFSGLPAAYYSGP
ncbi:SdrD B-like domain-containing protein, partial [Spirosoma sp. 48-14]|uniref:SdrD B-like domain-containing protein n=1 Tax=Spirosoma sp. 48-14 TaxID=1895854 RepID=UPI0025DAE5C5